MAKILLITFCVWVFCRYVTVYYLICSTHESLKGVLDPLELELQMVVATLWVVKTELEYSGREANAINC